VLDGRPDVAGPTGPVHLIREPDDAENLDRGGIGGSAACGLRLTDLWLLTLTV
jgi:hypothetical protein